MAQFRKIGVVLAALIVTVAAGAALAGSAAAAQAESPSEPQALNRAW